MSSSSSSWYRPKPYPHFDAPLGRKAATQYVSDPEKVARHAFFPLITYNLERLRFQKDPVTKKIVRDSQTGKPLRELKPRHIAYPCHLDGYIFSYYKFLLESEYENWIKLNGLGESVTAFRKGENNVSLAYKAFNFISSNPRCVIVATDISGFFDNLSHKILKELWEKFLGCPKLPIDHYAVFKAITRFSEVERQKVLDYFGVQEIQNSKISKWPSRICTPQQFRARVVARGLVRRSPGWERGVGIPQGTSLSPLLSNIYMAELDLAMSELVTFLGGRYWRYCDDILIAVPNENKFDILDYLDWWLRQLSLTRSEEKTQERTGQELPARQLQYLGFLFNGSKIVVRSSSIHRYHHKLKRAIQATKIRQMEEGKGKKQKAPFRRRALYNIYSELPVLGKNVKTRSNRRKLRGNFTHYMNR